MATGRSHDPDTIRSIYAALRRRAARLVAKREDVEDVVQETWLAALRQREAIRDSDGWLRRVVRYQALRRRRNEILRREREARVARGPHSVDEEREVEPMQRRVSEVLASLREPYRTVMRMRFEDELSPDEIARRLDRPVATVKSQINRAMKRMRSRLPEPERERGRSPLAALLAPVLRLTRRVEHPADALAAEPLLWTALCAAVASAVLVLTRDPRVLVPADALASATAVAEPAGSILTLPRGPAAARRAIDSDAERDPPRVSEASRPREGLVLDMSGAPADGARVWAAPRGAIGAAVHVATTDEAGRFRLRDVDPGTYFTAEGDGWLPRGWAVVEELASDDAVLNLRVLAARNRIHGRVRNEEGQALSYALVVDHREADAPWIEPPLGWRIPGSVPGARTGIDGSFELDAHHHFAHRLVVTAAGYAPALHGIRAGPETSDVEIVLTRGATLEGSVALPSDAAAIGASVEFVPDAPFPAITTRARLDGSFVLAHVAPGPGTLIVRGAGRDEGLAHRSRLEVPASAPLDILLSDRWSIRGDAHDARGRPLAGWTVIARRECDRPDLLERLDPWRGAEVRGVTDAEGRFALGGLEETVHRLHLLPPSEDTVARATVLVERPGGGEVALVARDDLARLVGRVPPTRTIGCTLILRAPELLHDRVVPFDAENGAFVAGELLAGDYTLFLFDPMGPPMRLGEWRVPSSAVVDVGQLALPVEGSLVLRVRGPSGPVDPHSVFLRSLEGYGIVQRLSEMSMPAPGELATRAVPNGAYEILVKAQDFADHLSVVAIDAPDQPVDVDLVRGGLVVVALRAPREFEAGRRIDLRFESFSGRAERRMMLVPAAVPDKLTLNLPFGWHRIHAVAGDGPARTVEFLVSGKQTSVEIDM